MRLTYRMGHRLAAATAASGMLLATLVHAQDRPPVRTVDSVDLGRYVGEWFEVARFPNRFQRKCLSDVKATYAIRPDGRIDVTNQCRTEDGRTDAKGVARVVDTAMARISPHYRSCRTSETGAAAVIFTSWCPGQA